MFSKDAVKSFVEFGASFSSGNRLREEAGVRNFNHAPRVEAGETREPVEGKRFLSADRPKTGKVALNLLSLLKPLRRDTQTKAYGHDVSDSFLVGLGIGAFAATVGAFAGFVFGPLAGLDPATGATLGAITFGVPFFVAGVLARAIFW